MAKHAIFRSDLMSGTNVAADLVSVKTPASTDVDNGFVLKVGALVSGEREVFQGAIVGANDAVADLVVIGTPEVMYDERLKNLSDFYNAAGSVMRGYRLRSGNIFSVTAEALTGTMTLNDIVELKATNGGKFNTAATATASTTTVGKIIAIEGDYYVIKVA